MWGHMCSFVSVYATRRLINESFLKEIPALFTVGVAVSKRVAVANRKNMLFDASRVQFLVLVFVEKKS